MGGYEIGKVFKRGKDYIYITSGEYIGGYGRISNHWSWRKVLKDGTLSKKEYNGYGDTSANPIKCKVTTTIKF